MAFSSGIWVQWSIFLKRMINDLSNVLTNVWESSCQFLRWPPSLVASSMARTILVEVHTVARTVADRSVPAIQQDQQCG